MAKLPQKTAKRVNAAEGSSFTPLPEGRYLVQLHDVKTDGEGPKGPYWTWELEVLQGPGEADDHKGRRLFVNTSLAEAADWKMKETFNAFGHDASSDTDDIIGEKAMATVTQRVIESGSRKGEVGNNVDRLMPVDGEGGGEDEEDVF